MSKEEKNDYNLNINNHYKIKNNNIFFDEIKEFENKDFLENKINVNILNEKSKLRRRSQQMHSNIYYNQNMFEVYFITPRNFNRRKKEKNLSSTKSTKITASSIGKTKSFSSTKVGKTNKINYKIKFSNNHDNNNYKIIKEIINNKKVFNKNKKNLNKTTLNNNSNKYIKANTINIINVNLKTKTKSSSNLTSKKKQFSAKNNHVLNLANNIKNNKNKIINNKIKGSLNTFQNIYKKIYKSGIKSSDKENNNIFNASKTLTEHNLIINKNQATPKIFKIQKFDSVPFTETTKKVLVDSSKRDSLMKFDSSLKKKEKTKTEQIKNVFKPKTQSDFKSYSNMFVNDIYKKSGNNIEYGNDKHVKQKLLDRMNKATNNWQCIFKRCKNKKVQDEGLSNIKSKNKDTKEYYNYFYKNENIISDESEKEDN